MKQQAFFWILSLATALLMCWTSFEGLMSPATYARETENWRVQSMGQDILNLAFIPFYLFSTNFITRRRQYLTLLWTGITIYYIYTYLIYCFNIHFNQLFVFYCLIVCFHFYSLLYLLFLYGQSSPVSVKTPPVLKKITGTYFIVISLLFYFLWLSEIIPAVLQGNVPESIELAGLFTNPVEVLDLSFVLPGVLIAGLLLFRKKTSGIFFAPIILTFLLLMELTIGALILILWKNGLESNPGVAWFVFALAAFNLTLLLLHLKQKLPYLL